VDAVIRVGHRVVDCSKGRRLYAMELRVERVRSCGLAAQRHAGVVVAMVARTSPFCSRVIAAHSGLLARIVDPGCDYLSFANVALIEGRLRLRLVKQCLA